MFKKLGHTILWLRANDYLGRYRPPVIGITGSDGTGIAKEAIAAAVSTSYRVRRSPDACHTKAGVAQSILGVTSSQMKSSWYNLLAMSKKKELTATEPDIIILELGAASPGSIDYVASHLPFTGAVITNVHSTNLHLFTSQEQVAHELMSLVVSIPSTGFVVLNGDDPLVRNMASHSKARVITYGTSATATVRLLHARPRGRVGYACAVNVAGRHFELHFPYVVSAHHITHFISALAVAHAMEMNLSRVIKTIQPLQPPSGQMRLLTGNNNATILDDSYDASLESMLSSLQTLHQFPAKRRIAILGDVSSLGPYTIQAHQEIGRATASMADVLVAVGTNMKHAGAAALHLSASNSDREPIDVHNFASGRDVGKWLRDFLHPDDVVLIKGSRDMHLEEATRRLLANPADESQLVQ